MKNREVIERILAYHPDLGEEYKGCDEYKCGDPEAECTGIAVSLVPTWNVIKKAAEQGCSLLVTHEPLYYQTPDFPKWRGSFDNSIQKEKQKLIEESGITIWRDHDHMHAHNPDSIFSGVIRLLGWEEYYRPEKNAGIVGLMVFDIPETSVEDLARHMKETIGMNGIRYIGRGSDLVTRIAIAGHLYPEAFEASRIGEDGTYHDYAMSLMEQMEKQGIQVLLPGEIIEWTVLSYIRDAVQMGKIRACLNAGHFNWEELGMKDFSEKIAVMAPEVKTVYIPSEDPYHFL